MGFRTAANYWPSHIKICIPELFNEVTIFAKKASSNTTPSTGRGVLSCQLRVVSCQLSVASCQLISVSCQLVSVSCYFASDKYFVYCWPNSHVLRQ